MKQGSTRRAIVQSRSRIPPKTFPIGMHRNKSRRERGWRSGNRTTGRQMIEGGYLHYAYVAIRYSDCGRQKTFFSSSSYLARSKRGTHLDAMERSVGLCCLSHFALHCRSARERPNARRILSVSGLSRLARKYVESEDPQVRPQAKLPCYKRDFQHEMKLSWWKHHAWTLCRFQRNPLRQAQQTPGGIHRR